MAFHFTQTQCHNLGSVHKVKRIYTKECLLEHARRARIPAPERVRERSNERRFLQAAEASLEP